MASVATHKKIRRGTRKSGAKQITTKNILVLVPYGNLHPEEHRADQLRQLLAAFDALAEGLPKKTYLFVCIVEQVQPLTYFNRGQLLNIGLQYFRRTYGNPAVLVLQDLDLIP